MVSIAYNTHINESLPKMKIRLTKRDEPLIRELKNGAYFLSDGANVSLHGSKVTANALTFRRLLNNGYFIDVFHDSKVFDERKYKLIPDFDFKKELKEETKKYHETLKKNKRKKLVQRFDNLLKISIFVIVNN